MKHRQIEQSIHDIIFKMKYAHQSRDIPDGIDWIGCEKCCVFRAFLAQLALGLIATQFLQNNLINELLCSYNTITIFMAMAKNQK